MFIAILLCIQHLISNSNDMRLLCSIDLDDFLNGLLHFVTKD